MTSSTPTPRPGLPPVLDLHHRRGEHGDAMAYIMALRRYTSAALAGDGTTMRQAAADLEAAADAMQRQGDRTATGGR